MDKQILDNTYQLIEEIGRGGFGAVYRAMRIDIEGTGQVAIKLLNKNSSLRNEDYLRFQQEATLMSQLIHPGIVAIYELGEDNGAYFIVMEFIKGLNLREYIKQRNSKLPLNEIISILYKAADILDYVHSHNIIHRDIKPQNMLILDNKDVYSDLKQLKIVDFGVARLNLMQQNNQKNIDGIIGTYAYMAPEATGLTTWFIDNRSDIYSLGIVAYELIAGKTPFAEYRNEDILKAQVEQIPLSLNQHKDINIPDILEKIIMKCIAKNPKDRYQSMFALACDLEYILNLLENKKEIENFEIATKDIGIGEIINSLYIGKEKFHEQLLNYLYTNNNSLKIAYIVGGIGSGKSRCLHEIRKKIEKNDNKYLSLHFNESEQRLPFQVLSHAINNFLYFTEKISKIKYKEYISNITSKITDHISTLSRLIPALKQNISEQKNNIFINNNDNIEEDTFDLRYIAPNSGINDAFLEVIKILGKTEDYFFILLDDIHFADSSTILLLLYLLENSEDNNKINIIITSKERKNKTNVILDNFIRKIEQCHGLCKKMILTPLLNKDVNDFFIALGVENITKEIVEFIIKKCNGSYSRLISTTKKMLAENILCIKYKKNNSIKLEIDNNKLKNMSIKNHNISEIIANIDMLEKRDLDLLKIIAICHENCEFNYFKLNSDYSNAELEARITSLIKRGILEISGNTNLPFIRKNFSFSHEKMRNSILLKMKIEERTELHFLIVKFIIETHTNPNKEQILNLARHCDGGAEKIDTNISIKAFLKASKIYHKKVETNFARYYLDKAFILIEKIEDKNIKLKRYQEYYEIEYMIYASKGNLIKACEICKNLIEITTNTQRKDELLIFLSQLLLGLGQHNEAFDISNEILKPYINYNKLTKILANITYFNLKFIWFNLYCSILKIIFTLPKKGLKEKHTISVTNLLLTSFHHVEFDFKEIFFITIKFRLLNVKLTKLNVINSLFYAILLMREGKKTLAYEKYEDCEKFIKINTMISLQNIALVIKCIWLDYANGRIDRLLDFIDSEQVNMLPNSGILHFESYALKSWLKLLSPSSGAARSAVNNEGKKRRKADKNSKNDHVNFNNNISRRVVDYSENNQYIALSLFSDVLRFSLIDKIEPLRKATEYIQQKQATSNIAFVFAAFTKSLQALILGHQHEALKYYYQSIELINNSNFYIISGVIADAIRLACIELPLLAMAFNAKGWSWNENLCNLLVNVNNKLIEAEGKNHPRGSSVVPLFEGFIKYLTNNKLCAYKLFEIALTRSRNHRTELIECLSLLLMGLFLSDKNNLRKTENFLAALKIASKFEFKLLERQIISLANIASIDLNLDKDLTNNNSFTNSSREKQTTIGLSEILLQIQKLHTYKSINELLLQSAKITLNVLKTDNCTYFLIEKNKFIIKELDTIKKIDTNIEKLLLRFLSKQADDPVKILSSQDIFQCNDYCKNDTDECTISDYNNDYLNTYTKNADTTTCVNNTEELTTIINTSITQISNENTLKNNTIEEKTSKTIIDNNNNLENKYIVLIAISTGKNLLGWMCFSHILPSVFAKQGMEQDLMVIGLHVGHLLLRLYEQHKIEVPGNQSEAPHNYASGMDKIKHIVDGDIPKNIKIEIPCKIAMGQNISWKIYSLKPNRILFVQWKFISDNTKKTKQIGELFERHLKFFIYSLRQSSEISKLENIISKLSSDIQTILESTCQEHKLDVIMINLLLIDYDEKRAFEGDFGGSYYSFVGKSEIENEYLQEIKNVLQINRLVYTEKLRFLRSDCAWLYTPSERSKKYLTNFSKFDLLNSYLNERNKIGPHLGRVLGIVENDEAILLAIFCVDMIE